MLQLRFPFSPRVNRDTEYVLTFDSVNKKKINGTIFYNLLL